MFGFALMCIAQWSAGKVWFLGHALVGASYFFSIALGMILGGLWAADDQFKPSIIFGATLMAASATVGIMLAQLLDVGAGGIWINAKEYGGRPFGNLMQTNNAASIINLGLLALLWLKDRQYMGRSSLVFCWMFLGFGLVMTGSRINILAHFVVIVVLLWRSRLLGETRRFGFFALLYLAALLLVSPYVWSYFGLDPESSMITRTVNETRMSIFQAFFAASFAKPLSGYGFGQAQIAQMQAADFGYALPGTFIWTHNVFLDLIIWFGYPAFFIFVLAWLVSVMKMNYGLLNRQDWILVASFMVIALHAMVELPHGYLFFSLPAAVIWGYLYERAAPPVQHVNSIRMRFWMICMALSGAFLLISILHDYLEAERSLLAWRMKYHRIGFSHPIDLPDVIMLNQFRGLMLGMWYPVDALDGKALKDFEEAVFLVPSEVGIQKLIRATVESGNPARAQLLVDRFRLILGKESRVKLSIAWNAMAQSQPLYRSVSWLP